MKIAFIGHKGIPAKIGGVERYTEEIAILLAKRGHEVFAYVRDNYTDKNLKEYKGVKLIHLPAIHTKNLDAITHTLLATIHALFQHYDVIQYHSLGPTSLSFIPKIFNPKTAVLSIYQSRDYLHRKWGCLAKAYLKFSEYITCRVPDKTIAVTKLLAELAKEKYGMDLPVIPNGASADPTADANCLAKWNLEKGRYFLAVSRFIRHKGLHYLIEAFKILEDAGRTKNMKLVLVGDGFHTSDYVNYLKKISWGRENIIFTGIQSGKTLHQLCSHAYCFVQPSESEGLSLALLEAMAYGLPVIASDIPENLEAVQNQALTFRNKNVDDLTKKIAQLVENPEAAEEMGRELKKLADTRYNWEAIADQFESVYKEITQLKTKNIWKKCLPQKFSGE